jgi:hypothetical protein
VDEDPEERYRLQQYEIVWIPASQHRLPDHPDGFGLEVVDFLGPGDPDHRGEPTVWVRGPVVGTGRRQGHVVAVAIPHDQPRACRSGVVGGVACPVGRDPPCLP